jgi:hypothetical protein
VLQELFVREQQAQREAAEPLRDPQMVALQKY